MATYRVIARDLRTQTRIAEIPLAGLSYGSILNGAGELSGTLFLPPGDSTYDKTLAAIFNDAVDEVRRELIVERDGVVVWTGVVWASPYQDDNQTRSVRAAETWSYFRRRIIGTRRVYAQADQLTIARQLMVDAQAVTGGNINVTIGSETSGVLRDRKYEAWEYKQLGEAIEQLAAVINGFDFAIDATWASNGDLTKTFRLSYPRRGRSQDQTGLMFEVGRNVISWDWPTDGTRYANRVHNIGAGEAEAMLRVTVSEESQLDSVASGGPGYPLIEKVVSHTDVSQLSTLTAQARDELLTSAREVVLPSVTIRADVEPFFGSYITGDSCRFVCQPGLSPRFPDGIDTLRRIVGWSVKVDDNGGEEVQLTLGDDFSG